MKEVYNNGDKVQSNLRGFYFGIKGTIIKPADFQDNKFKKYIIELETGQRITLPTNCIIETE